MNYHLSVFVAVLCASTPSIITAKKFAYVGGFTDPAIEWVGGTRGKGIEVFEVDDISGDFTPVQTVGVDVTSPNPRWLTVAHSKKYLYAGYQESGGVAGYSINAETGALTKINFEEIPGTSMTVTYMTITKDDRFAHVAYYAGSYAVFPLNADGSVGKSIFHQAIAGANNTGDVQEMKTLEVSTPTGSGPRHLVFHKTLPYAYLVTEYAGTVIVYSYNSATGQLTSIQNILNLMKPLTGNDKARAAAIRMSENGKFLYVSNRARERSTTPLTPGATNLNFYGEDSVAQYAINQNTGKIDRITENLESDVVGAHARDIVVNDNNLYVLGQDSNIITRYLIVNTGALAFGESVVENIGNPTTMVFAAFGSSSTPQPNTSPGSNNNNNNNNNGNNGHGNNADFLMLRIGKTFKINFLINNNYK
eukprot:Pgem_evm2s18305